MKKVAKIFGILHEMLYLCGMHRISKKQFEEAVANFVTTWEGKEPFENAIVAKVRWTSHYREPFTAYMENMEDLLALCKDAKVFNGSGEVVLYVPLTDEAECDISLEIYDDWRE